jgi:2-polyprenyl-3-methyl-5-hydroxy-6-metoxy-1,4-benzoquinol methylase
MKKTVLIVSFIFAMATVSSAQLTKEQFIQGVAGYRSLVIKDAVRILVEFNLLVDSLKKQSDHPEKHEALREYFMYHVLHERFWEVRDLIDKGFTDLEPKNMRAYKSWGSENAYVLHELNILAGNKIIETTPPFKLTDISEFWKEIEFYNVHAHQKILDLGAGNGFISFILALSGIQADIYLTEIDESIIPYLEQTIERIEAFPIAAQLHLSKSSEKNIGGDTSKFDLVIMREVFHHLKFPAEILDSIKKNLTKDGFLCIVETTRDIDLGNERRCPQSTTKEKIIEFAIANGFQLVDFQQANLETMLRFRPQ